DEVDVEHALAAGLVEAVLVGLAVRDEGVETVPNLNSRLADDQRLLARGRDVGGLEGVPEDGGRTAQAGAERRVVVARTEQRGDRVGAVGRETAGGEGAGSEAGRTGDEDASRESPIGLHAVLLCILR